MDRNLQATDSGHESSNVVDTGIGYEDLVKSVMESKQVTYTYNEHYHVYITFGTDGTAHVEDEGEEYTVGPNEKGVSGVRVFIHEVRSIAESLKRVLPRIPKGNLEDMGGIEGLINAYKNVLRAEGYYYFDTLLKGRNDVRTDLTDVLGELDEEGKRLIGERIPEKGATRLN